MELVDHTLYRMVSSWDPVPRRRMPRLPAGWPIYVLFVGFPLWWILGLGGLIWPILAIPMGAWLFRQPRVLAPRGFAIWLAFLLWIPISATQLDSSERYIAFGFRASLYLAATIVLLYVFNISREMLPTARLIKIMVAFWAVVVAGGYLGVLAPDFSIKSPVEYVMPDRLLANEFVHDLVHPASAQTHTFLGYAQPRPKAPFVYATNWGSAFGLLTPFVILGWMYAGSRAWKLVMAGGFVAAIVPVVASLNRGLWLSLGVGLVYAAVRLALGGRGRALRAVLIVTPVIVAVVLLTPLKVLVEDRLEHPHSNERRIGLYQEAVRGVLDSPLVGYGSPRPSSENPDAPNVGTQGQLWLVLYSHGILGGLLFVWWFLYQFWRMRRSSTPVSFWCHVLILIALVQLPFYAWLPAPLILLMTAIALSTRELAPARARVSEHPEPREQVTRAFPETG